jgi:NADH-quinone oxidoreductase subunit L
MGMAFREVVSSGEFFRLVPLVVFFPVIGLLANITFGGRMREKAIGAIASLAVGASFVVAVMLGISLLNHPEGETIKLLDWMVIGGLQVEWAFRVDTLSVTMMLVVAGVGSLIHIYAIGYMHEDVRHNGDPGRFRRFFVFFNLFIATMMVLVSADNYLMMFVGWEGVGLCSYLLIGFWYEKGKDGIGNALAAKKAFVTNRIGDFGFLIAVFLMFGAFGSFQFDTVFAKAPQASQGVILAITLFMLLGVAGKSAQLPLHVWLPDAMAGPTPVSALIHAATMVTAGVYLVARSYALYSLVPQAQTVVAVVGGLTALFAATIAVGQFDIKKVLAYSTISQLGFMVAAVGMGAFVAGMFHLVTHAFFKALLFLSAGSVIQGMEHGEYESPGHLATPSPGHPVTPSPGHLATLSPGHLDTLSPGHLATPSPDHPVTLSSPHPVTDPQDMRNMGGLKDRMKVTFWVYAIGALALAGIFPLAGFWSKDEILAEAVHQQPIVFSMLLLAAFFTAFYMGRQVWMVFFGKPRTPLAEHARENPPVMVVPLIVLAALSLVGGALNLPWLHSFSHWLGHSFEEAEASGRSSLLIAGASTVLALAAIGLAWQLYGRRFQVGQELPAAKSPVDPVQPYLRGIFTGMQNKWWVDEAYDWLILRRYVALSRFLAEVVEWHFWHDWFHDVVVAGGYRLVSRVLSVQIDLGIIDATANGLAAVTRRLAAYLRRLQNGYVHSYALWVFVGVVVILGYLIIR